MREWRFIPAYAGWTTETCRVMPAMWVHPSVCGVDRMVLLSVAQDRGSSQRMRGGLWFFNDTASQYGFIPVYAGGGPHLHHPAVSPARFIHAHAGGPPKRLSPEGSSPRTLGQRQTHLVQRGVDGLIPAHAGATTTDI